MKKPAIFIYDYIGSESVNANYIRQIITQYEDQGFNEFELHINSMGGSAFEGIAIYNFLKNKSVDVYIEGVAASIASVIAMCGKTINMYKSSMIMVHNPVLWNGGEAEELRQQADMLDQVKKAIVEAYVERTKLPRADVEQLMDATTWFTAAEAVKKGFADSIIKAASVKNYVGVYSMLIGDDENSNKNKDTKMNKSLLALFGLPENATDEQVADKLTEVRAQLGLKADAKIEEVAAALQAKLAPAAEQPKPAADNAAAPAPANEIKDPRVDRMLEDIKKDKAEQLINSAVADFKILASDKDVYLAQAVANYEGTKKILDARAKNSVKPEQVKVNQSPSAAKATVAELAQNAADYLKAQMKVQ